MNVVVIIAITEAGMLIVVGVVFFMCLVFSRKKDQQKKSEKEGDIEEGRKPKRSKSKPQPRPKAHPPSAKAVLLTSEDSVIPFGSKKPRRVTKTKPPWPRRKRQTSESENTAHLLERIGERGDTKVDNGRPAEPTSDEREPGLDVINSSAGTSSTQKTTTANNINAPAVPAKKEDSARGKAPQAGKQRPSPTIKDVAASLKPRSGRSSRKSELKSADHRRKSISESESPRKEGDKSRAGKIPEGEPGTSITTKVTTAKGKEATTKGNNGKAPKSEASGSRRSSRHKHTMKYITANGKERYYAF